MKKIFLFMAAMVAFSANIFAANITKDVKVGNFIKIDVSYSFDITVVKSSEPSVTITIDEEYEPYLVVRVSHGVLFVGIDAHDCQTDCQKIWGIRCLKQK